MSITLTTTPDANVAAFAPVTLAGSTTRNPFVSGVRDTKTAGAYSSDGGFLKITVTDGDDWEVDDVVTISGSSNDDYNRRHTITAVTSTTVKFATAYTSSASSGVGTLSRMNEGLNIKVEVENSSSTVISTMYANVDTSDGTWSIDISRALQYELSSYFSLTTGEVSTATASHSYTIVVYESWLDEDYATTTDQHGTEPTTIGHMTTELPSDDNFQQGNYFFNTIATIHYVNDTSNNFRFYFEYSDGTTGDSGTLTGTRWHYAYTLSKSNIEWIKVTAQEYVDAVWEDLSDTIIIRQIGCSSQLLYYLDRYGNYLAYNFHDYENDQKVTKVDKYTGESWLEKTMFGYEYQNGEYQDIRDIISSPEVRDEDETLVKVLTNSLTYRAEDVSPTIVLRYDENLIQ